MAWSGTEVPRRSERPDCVPDWETGWVRRDRGNPWKPAACTLAGVGIQVLGHFTFQNWLAMLADDSDDHHLGT